MNLPEMTLASSQFSVAALASDTSQRCSRFAHLNRSDISTRAAFSSFTIQDTPTPSPFLPYVFALLEKLWTRNAERVFICI